MSKINEEKSQNIQVIVRVRPFFKKENVNGIYLSTIEPDKEQKNKLNLYEYHNIKYIPKKKIKNYLQDPDSYTIHQFKFDKIFDKETDQSELYEKTTKNIIPILLKGINSSIICYGQTGTGKTYTMTNLKNNSKGILPRAIDDLYKKINETKNEFIIKVSYLQIYNKKINDLLIPERKSLNIRENNKKGVYIEGLSNWVAKKKEDIFKLLEKGEKSRKSAFTLMNDISSRSHVIFNILIESKKIKENQEIIKTSNIKFVDLAGSERLRITKAKGEQLSECKHINKSLSCLKNVIKILGENKRKHIPFRDSKLTRILQDCLGSNCKTIIITCVSPSIQSFGETLSSLKFGSIAKNVKNFVQINKKVKKKPPSNLIYKDEIDSLKIELSNLNKNLVNRSVLIKLEKEKNKALEDRELAIEELEKQYFEFLKEQKEKKELMRKLDILGKYIIENSDKLEPILEVNEDNENLNDIIFEKEEEIGRLKKNLEMKEKEIFQRSLKIDNSETINEDKENLNKIIFEKEKEIERLKTNLEIKEKEIYQKKYEIMNSDKKDTNLEINEENENLDDIIFEKEEEIGKLKLNLEMKEKEIFQFKQELDTYDMIVRNSKNQIDFLRTENNDLKNLVDFQKKKLNCLENTKRNKNEKNISQVCVLDIKNLLNTVIEDLSNNNKDFTIVAQNLLELQSKINNL